MPSRALSRSRVHDLSWRRRDLGPLIFLCAAGAALLGPSALRGRPEFDPARPGDPVRIGLAAERIDPNTADAASLQRLPNIGPAKARAIVAFRRDNASAAFRSPGDLRRIPGIGPGTVEAIKPYLRIRARRPDPEPTP